MQIKILVCNLILSLIIFNVVAQDVDNKGDVDNDDDVDEDFDRYKANLLIAVETLSKDLNSRDVPHLQRRGWFKNVWRNVVRPVLTNLAVKYVAGVLVGKRISDENEALNPAERELNGTQCEKDAAQFQEVKKAASQLCALTKFPNLKCP